MRKELKVFACSLFLGGCVLLSGCSKKEESSKVKLDPEHPVTIRVWNYYQGAQQESFNDLVKEYNKGEGAKVGINVKTTSIATVVDVENNVTDAINGKVGAGDPPDIFSAYADTVYKLDQKKKIVDLGKYLTKEDQNKFVKEYLEDGMYLKDGSIKLFPTAKAVELLELNETDWNAFAKATGAKKSDLSTMEGIVKVSKQYYKWTDAKTPNIKNDGKAFFGRDSFSNYMIIGAKQLGVDIFTQKKDGKIALNFDKKVMKQLWDNYYVPYISGYFKSVNRFSSDDLKMGEIVSFVGSSSGVTFVADEKIISDTESKPITVKTYEAPCFKDGEDYAVQQGAGMAVLKSSKKKEYASVEFLKWFTQKERNTEFSLKSGYLPVLKAANKISYLKDEMKTKKISTKVSDAVETSMKTIENHKLYTVAVNENMTDARSVLDQTMTNFAKDHRKQVESLLKQGSTLENAVSKYDTQEEFDTWYENTKKELEKLI